MFIERSVKSEQTKQAEHAFLAQAAKLITDVAWHDVGWSMVLDMFMFGDLLERVPRLIRSQSFGDPDYPNNVNAVFQVAHECDSQRAIAMVVYIIQEEMKANTQTLEKYPIVEAYLQNKELPDYTQILAKFGTYTSPKYLDITEVPDDFYRDLLDLINKCYTYGIYPAVNIFSRKLLENLLVDILRRKYSMKNVALFFDTEHGKHHSFNVLLKNFAARLGDFKIAMPSLDHEFINKVSKFRESGNSAAHTLEIDIKRKEVDQNRDDLEFVVKTLIRLYKNV